MRFNCIDSGIFQQKIHRTFCGPASNQKVDSKQDKAIGKGFSKEHCDNGYEGEFYYSV